MRVVTALFARLKSEYGNVIDFKRICKDYNIGVTTAALPDGVNGNTTFTDTHATIVMNESLSKKERHDWAWHELFHALRKTTSTSAKEETRATLFAALILAPTVHADDNVFTLADRYCIPHRIAKARIDHELKQMTS
jgi:Zn-dependent peptidase ImmA (M78 family)